MNVFYRDLAESQTLSSDADWVDFYKRTFPGLIGCAGIEENSAWQQHGVDRILFFRNGKQLTVDEKKRRKDYGDFLAEIWSVYKGDRHPQNKPGWTVDPNKTCDFIAYAIPSAGRCYLLPFEILRLTTRRCFQQWREVPPAKNDGYCTINRAVRWDDLFIEMRRTMSGQYTNGAINLTSFSELSGQGTFSFQ